MRPSSKTNYLKCQLCDAAIERGALTESNYSRRKFCSPECLSAWKKRPRYDPARFWAKVDKSGGPDACWPYTGYITPEGYGWAYTGLPTGQQQTHGAHRQAWINTYGPIPRELNICHHCDNPPCCNPRHLFSGTCDDNTQDMIRKERHRRILSAAQVREIIPLKGKEKVDDVGSRYGVGGAAIAAIWAGRSWWHLQPPDIQEKMKDYHKKKKVTGPRAPKGPRPRTTSPPAAP